MLLIPLSPVPSQTLRVLLGTQDCQISVYEKQLYGVFLDLYVANALVLGGAICLNDTLVVRSSYLNFVGDLVFHDTQGSDDPVSAGLGSRFVLLYVEASEL